MPAAAQTLTISVTGDCGGTPANCGTSGTPATATVTIRGTDSAPSFGTGSVSAKTFTAGAAITDFQVPAATGGVTYAASGSLGGGAKAKVEAWHRQFRALYHPDEDVPGVAALLRGTATATLLGGAARPLDAISALRRPERMAPGARLDVRPPTSAAKGRQ